MGLGTKLRYVLRGLLALATAALATALPASSLDFERLAKRSWVSSNSEHFEVVSDLSERRLFDITEQLERYATFCTLLLRTSGAKKIERSRLVVVEKEATWEYMGLEESLVAIHSRDLQPPIALLNLGAGFSGGLDRASSERSELFKVIALQQLRAADAGGTMPVWYQEGMALYLSTYFEKKSKVLLGDLQALPESIVELINVSGGLRDVNSEALFNTKQRPSAETETDPVGNLSQLYEFYAQSFMTLHFFQSSKEYQLRLNRYLSLLDYGDNQADALAKAFGWTFAELDREVERYSRGPLFARAFSHRQLAQLIDAKKPGLADTIQLQEIEPESALVMYAELMGLMSLRDIPDDEKREFINKVGAFQGPQDSAGSVEELENL